MITKRKFLTGLIAAPAIVSFGSLMPVRALASYPGCDGSFATFLKTPYGVRMVNGLGDFDYINQQVQEFRDNPGHVMGPDHRKWYRAEEKLIFGGETRTIVGYHDAHLRQQIRDAIHATRSQKETF